MAWEVVAIWLVVAVTLIVFVRSEKQREMAALRARARHFATAPAYRHHSLEASHAPRHPYVPMGLAASDRLFLEDLARRRKR